MKKRQCILFLLVLISFSINAQKDIGRIYGSLDIETAYSLTISRDSNYFITGVTKSYSDRTDEVYVLKIDQLGSLVFENYYGSKYHDRGFCIDNLEDGNFIITGESWHGFGSIWGRENIFLLKINQLGEIIWQKALYLPQKDQGFCVKELSDNNLLVVGYTMSFANRGSIYVVKTDKEGEKLWEKTFITDSVDYGFDFVELQNNDLLILGNAAGFFNSVQNDYRTHDADIKLIKLDSYGNEIWSKLWGEDKHDLARQIIQTSDDDFFIIGSTQSNSAGSFDILLLKIDGQGDEIWNKTYGGQSFDYGQAIDITTDKQFLYIAGVIDTEDDIAETDIFVLKTDLFGNEIWSHTITRDGADNCFSVKALENGGCIIAGNTNNNDNQDIILLKFGANGEILFHKSYNSYSSRIYPNPAYDQTNIEIYSTNNLLSYKTLIYNLKGELVKEMVSTSYINTFSVYGFQSGVYAYRILVYDEVVLTGKFIVY